ncbi:hypothetical protein HY612_02610 [Candidatus Roizmanbacteria bacterium]|nr:hypothetical protein [Candidatus Roizmanbacteria bacterium]
MVIEDILFFPFFSLLIFFFLYLPGKFLLRIVGANVSGLFGLAMAFGLGMTVMPFIYNIGFQYLGFSTFSYWLISTATITFLYFLQKYKKTTLSPKNKNFKLFPSKGIGVISISLIAILMFIVFLGYVQVKPADKKWRTSVIADTDKHYMIVTSLLTSKKFPPQVGYFRLSQDLPLRYYYFYYLLPASFIGGLFFLPHISNIFAIMSAMSVGIILILFAGIAKEIFQNKMAPFFAILIGYLSGLQFPYLLDQFKNGNLLRWASAQDNVNYLVLKLFPSGVDTTPQHFFASGIFFLMISLLLTTQKKNLKLIILLALLHASSFMFSLHMFAAITLALLLFGQWLIGSEKYKIFAKVLIYTIAFLIFFLPLQATINRAGDPLTFENSFSETFRFGYVDFLKSPIFGKLIKEVSIKSNLQYFFYYFLFYLERLGALFVIGLLGMFYFRKKIFENPGLALITSIIITTFLSINFLRLPGPQNEYSKNATLFITYGLGLFMAGYLSTILEKKNELLTIIKKVCLILLLILSLMAGLWEYYFAIIDIKLNAYATIATELEDVKNFLKSKDRDAIVFVNQTYFPFESASWFVNLWAMKKVNFSPLSLQAVYFENAKKEYYKYEQIMGVFNNGPFDKNLWDKLHSWNSSYVLITRYDKIFANRDALIDKNLFKEVFKNDKAVVYKVTN